MKAVKLSVAAAAALALTTAACAAEGPKVYGQINAELGSFQEKADGAKSYLDAKSYSSRLGVKGSMDLGNGMTGLYQVEMALDPMKGKSENDGRNTFVGVSGSFGTLIAGNHDTPYKIASRALGNIAYSDATSTLTLNEQRPRKAVAYIAPIEGMTLAAAIVPVPYTDASGDDASGMHMSLGFVLPVSDELKIAAGYESLYANTVNGAYGVIDKVTGTSLENPANPAWNAPDSFDSTADFIFVGANFAMGNMTIGASVENITADGEAFATRILVPFTMKMDGGMFVGAALRSTSWDSDISDESTTDIGVALGKKYNKNFETYVAFKSVTNQGGVKDDSGSDIALGMRVKF